VQPYDDDDDEGLPRSHRLGAAVPGNKLDVDISFTVTWNQRRTYCWGNRGGRLG